MSNIYVNITETTPGGLGSIASPYNYQQLVNFLDPSKVIEGYIVATSAYNGDTVYVKGNRSNNYVDGPNFAKCFLPISTGLSGTVDIEGWDIVTNGSPIASTMNSIFLRNSGSSLLNLNVKDFIFVSFSDLDIYNAVPVSPYQINTTFKDVLVKSGRFDYFAHGESNVSVSDTLSFYGCTLDCDDLAIGHYLVDSNYTVLSELNIYDSVLMFLDGEFDIPTIQMNNNITNVVNFDSYVSFVAGANYISPTYNSGILRYPTHTDPVAVSNFYSDKVNLNYTEYAIPIGGASNSFRATNDYTTGVFGEARLSYGSYYFVNVPEELGKGHIGSFYFGGEYVNGDGSFEPAIITFSIISSASVSSKGSGIATIQFSIPDGNAIGFDPFSFDFSGTPLSGSSPLCVKYTAYNYEPKGQFEGLWEASEFRWWFDYGTSGGANDYISCATDVAEYQYCGFYGSEYDVRLCVLYTPIS